MNVEHDENEKAIVKQEFEHKSKNSTKNAKKVKIQKRQIQMIKNYQK
jgi:hypothetical protein